MIRITPVSVTEALIRQVDHADKVVLLACVLVVAAAAAASVGATFALGRLRAALGGTVVLGLLPVASTRSEATVSPGRELLVLLPSALLGAALLWLLGRPLLDPQNPASAEASRQGSTGKPRESRDARRLAEERTRDLRAQHGWYRRQLLKAATVLVGSAVVGTALARRVTAPSRALMIRLRAALPHPRTSLAPLTEQFAARGASPLVTQNSAFYRIDTALTHRTLTPSLGP